MEGYGKARYATDDNIIRRTALQALQNKATDPHSELIHQTTYTLKKYNL
jgi:hypothetical protein